MKGVIAFPFIILCAMILVAHSAWSVELKEDCQLKPVDIVFVLDSSTSIWLPHWNQMLEFVKNLIRMFNLSPDKARIGIMTFTDDVKIWWQLHDFTSREDLLRAFGNIRKMQGNTNTAKALRTLRKKMFTREFGARDGVSQIAVLMTDGRSDYRRQTRREALLLKKLTNVKVIAVGIGAADEKELKFIASKSKKNKKERNYYYLEDFSQLNYKLKLELSTRTCELQKDKEDSPLTQCEMAGPADVLFVSDPFSLGPHMFQKAKGLFKAVLDKLPVSEFGYRAGVIPETPCMGDSRNAPMSHFYDSDIALNATADRIGTNREYLARHLQYIRTHVLRYATDSSRRKAVVMAVDSHQNMAALTREAESLALVGVDVIPIAFDSSVSRRHLLNIASSPSLALRTSNLDVVSALEGDVIRGICPISY